jgi:uncharacterized membrane protein HdeD (DUF308 family)
MSTDLIQSAYRRVWWGLVLRGLLAIALGAVILWRPLESVAAFALFIAIYALFSGIVQVVHAFDLRTGFDRWWLPLVSGLVSIAFGFAALYYYPVLSLAFAVAWTAWWLLLSGALAAYAAVVERQIGVSWGWTMVFGMLGIAAGVFALLSPPTTLAALMGLIAGFAIVGGVVLLVGSYRLSSFKRDVTRVTGAVAAH